MTFFQAFIYLLAAVISVPLAKRLGLGSVLGYLLAGVVIGPFCFRLVGSEGDDVMHIAEFGVVMMLFVIGLELRPAVLWRMRGPILGLGGAQVVVTTGSVALAALWLGVSWQVSVAVGFIVAMSSTAIVLQLLNEKDQMRTAGGKAAFSVLLFQDIAVLPILALLPLLATLPATGAAHGEHGALNQLPGWQQALLVLAAITAVILAGRFLLRPFFRYIAATHLREMFTVTALLLVVGIALLMQRVGLSPALGAFLAGVVLAESEYRHQLETDIEPFKGLLLGLFFISVGAGINFALILHQPGTVALLVVAVLALKFVVLLAVSRISRLEPTQRYLFAFALAQGGEFAFVLCSFATQNGVLTSELANLLVATVALTMAAAPLLFVINERYVQTRFSSVLPEREPDEIDEHDNPVILAGVGRFGHIVARLLRANGFGTTVLDSDPDQVETLRRFGLKSFYGDATRLDLLRTAGAERARIFVIAIDDEDKALELVDLVHEHFPHLRILARATSRQHAYQLLRRGVTEVYRETLGSALDLSVGALAALGMEMERAQSVAQIFRQHDEASVRAMADIDEQGEAYVSVARLHIENLERALQSDRESSMPLSFAPVRRFSSVGRPRACARSRVFCALAVAFLSCFVGSADGAAGSAVWIDTDPAIGAPWREVDDAFALVLALHSPELRIAGVSTTYGNAGLARTTAVARQLVRRFSSSRTVATETVHGGAGSPSDPRRRTDATEALARALRKEKLTYLALGPLTNLANFLRVHPGPASRIEAVVFVGGRSPDYQFAFGHNGWLRIHDANVLKDPSAARLILQSSLPVVLVPVESASQLVLERADRARLREGGAAARFLHAKTGAWNWFWSSLVQHRGGPLFDCLAVMRASNPELVPTEIRYASMRGNDLIAARQPSSGARAVRFVLEPGVECQRKVVERLLRDPTTRRE